MLVNRIAGLNRVLETTVTGLQLIKERRTSPPTGTSTELGRLLWVDPAPLIHPRLRMIIIWSAKSASTPTMIWFFHLLGQLSAARDFSGWPADYRDYVYYYSELYREGYAQDLTSFK